MGTIKKIMSNVCGNDKCIPCRAKIRAVRAMAIANSAVNVKTSQFEFELASVEEFIRSRMYNKLARLTVQRRSEGIHLVCHNVNLQCFIYLRYRFPDVDSFFVDRSEDTKHASDNERYLVQIGSKGFYMKISTLKRCSFFETMFSHVVRETLSGRCHLKSNEYLFEEGAFCAVMEYIGNGFANYSKYGWVDVLMASEYLGCDEMKKDIDSYIVKYGPPLDLESSVLVLHQIETQRGWGLLKAAALCLEVIKSNLQFLHCEESPFKLIRRLSRVTIFSLLNDPRLTYFTARERHDLVWKWASVAGDPQEVHKRATLFRFIDTMHDHTCSSLPFHPRALVCFQDPSSSQTCLDHLQPTIILAGGTGEGAIHSTHRFYTRSMTPSKSLMAYSIGKDAWTILPNLPIAMVKPVVATNNADEIYVLDSHAFRDQDLIPTHILFSLRFNRTGWHWKSFSFEIPYGIRSFQLTNIFCVESKVYLLGCGKVYDQVVQDWRKGPQYRENLLASIESNLYHKHIERGRVLLMTLDLRDGTFDLLRFLYNVDMECESMLQACLVDDRLCMETSAGYLLEEDATCMSQVFAVFNFKNGHLYSETGCIIPFEYDVMVPNANRTGIFALIMGACCYRLYNFGELFQVNIGGRILPFPQTCIMGREGAVRRSYTMVAHGKKVYYIGGWSVGSRRSLNTAMVFTMPDLSSEPKWECIAALPRHVTHGGAAFCNFAEQCILHHPVCPHCKMYPKDVREADESEVNIPPDYEANLLALYPADGPY